MTPDLGFRNILMDADPIPASDWLDGITSTDVLGFLLCLGLTLLAFKMKSFPFAAVSGIGWLVVGFQVASTTGSPAILILVFAIAAGVILHGSKFEKW